MIWEDTTSYARSDKERTPRTFTARDGKIRIVLTKLVFDGAATRSWYGSLIIAGASILDGVDCGDDLEEAKVWFLRQCVRAVSGLVGSMTRLAVEGRA